MDAFTGMIAMFGFNYAPHSWAYCAGQIIGISQYPALYSLIGTFYGGDGRTSMGLPDFRARGPVGSTVMGLSPTVPGTTYPMGMMTGWTEVTLGVQNLPSHTHTATFTPTGGGGGSSVSVDIAVSTTDGDVSNATSGALLSQGKAGLNAAKMFQTNTSVGTVPLGGVTASGGGGGITGGSVAVGDTGNNIPVANTPPITAITFSIMLDGLYPSRN